MNTTKAMCNGFTEVIARHLDMRDQLYEGKLPNEWDFDRWLDRYLGKLPSAPGTIVLNTFKSAVDAIVAQLLQVADDAMESGGKGWIDLTAEERRRKQHEDNIMYRAMMEVEGRQMNPADREAFEKWYSDNWPQGALGPDTKDKLAKLAAWQAALEWGRQPFSVYDKVWIMEHNVPKQKIIFAIIESMDWFKRKTETKYRLVDSRIGAGWVNNAGIERGAKEMYRSKSELLESLASPKKGLNKVLCQTCANTLLSSAEKPQEGRE